VDEGLRAKTLIGLDKGGQVAYYKFFNNSRDFQSYDKALGKR
jgi:hypothetical protein